jgi:hypothetical protein
MRIIEIIRGIVRREKLDPTFKNSFITNDPKIQLNITPELVKYVVWYLKLIVVVYFIMKV